MFNVTLLPACSMQGVEEMHCWTFLSMCRFFGVFALSASYTRWMHSLLLNEGKRWNVWTSNNPLLNPMHTLPMLKVKTKNSLCHQRTCLKVQNFHRRQHFYASDVFDGESYARAGQFIVVANKILQRSRKEVFIALHVASYLCMNLLNCHVILCYCFCFGM